MFYQLRFFNASASDATISTQSGVLIAAKTAAQVCTGIAWGRIADAAWVGRKLVLVIGLLSAGQLSLNIREAAELLLTSP